MQCIICGAPAAPKGRRGPQSRYCSARCRKTTSRRRRDAARADTRARRRAQLRCEHCGAEFSADRLARRFCSPKCRRDSHREFVEATCELCGDVFTFAKTPAGRYGTRFCSKRCRSRSARWKANQLRRAATRAIDAEEFDLAEILKRDGCKCHICGRSIDPHLGWPHPQSASIDHLVPVSRGGSHTRQNVAAAHLFCNIGRGADRAPAQLRLIG